MTDEWDDEQKTYWNKKLDQARRDKETLDLFVMDGRDSGQISKQAASAYFRAAVAVVRRVGLPLQFGGEYVGDSVLASTMVQSQHEAKLALLAAQPDLEPRIRQLFPSSNEPGRSL